MKKRVLMAAALLFALSACKQTATENSPAEEVETQTVEASDLAFVNAESVLMECDLFKTEGTALREKTEKAQQSWANKERNLQNEAAQLQDKYQRGLITSRDAQAQQEALQKKAENHQANLQKEAQTLEEENFVFTNRMQDLLLRAVQAVNADKRYKMVVNASALLDADLSLDITAEVLDKMNELYAEEKADKKK